MPRVFEKDGYRFLPYSSEHRPIHVHVQRGGGEAVFDVENTVELLEPKGIKVKELARAAESTSENR